MINNLRQHFANLDLPREAAAWLLDLWVATQHLDDVVDGDPVDRDDMQLTIFSLLVGMPSNPFFRAHMVDLLPVLASMVLKWKASDDAEREGRADERSFVWRAGYYDVVLSVVLLCHGPVIALTAARDVLSLYGETFTEYREEFPHA